MKVLFVNPSRGGQGYIPLNIPLLIAILRKNNHDVRLFDMSDYEIFDKKSYGKQTDSIFKEAHFDIEKVIEDRRAFDPTLDDCELKTSDYSKDFKKILDDFRPDIIAVSCLTLDFKFISEFLPKDIPIVFGGIHAILHPEETINSCDFVCTGEAENSLPALLRALENNKSLEERKGIWFKRDGEIIKNPPIQLTDLAYLPFPDYDYFDPIHFYRPFEGKRYKMVNYELSRGCPFSCSYCVNSILKEKYKNLGKFNRIKDMNHSIKELKYLINRYKFNFIRFWDDDFITIKIDYLEKYARLYLKEINLPFLINARVEAVTEEKLKILKEMGCKSISMGIEHGNEDMRKNIMNRKMSNKTIIEKFKLVKSFGIRTSAYNLMGFPYETRERIFETIELNREANPDGFSINFLHPYKNIPIRKLFEECGLDPNYEVTQNSDPHFIPKGMTYQELKGLKRTFPFYVTFPKNRWDEIQLAETNDTVYQKLQEGFTRY